MSIGFSVPTDVTVLIPTHNRADSLRQTLTGMRELDAEGISANFVVVDNNSADGTANVVRSFSREIDIDYIFESRQGKNNALNRALDECNLGEIVVFTDDDVTPDRSWLKSIAESCRRYPGYSVFGGKIDIIWPQVDIPGWVWQSVFHVSLQGWAFTKIDHGKNEQPWPPDRYPGGPNYWVRSNLLKEGRRFDSTLGPKPKNRIMGDEAKFLKELRDDGHEFFYVPGAAVGHRIQPEMVSAAGIRKRAAYMGRSRPHLNGLSRRKLFEAHPNCWRFLRVLSALRYAFNYGTAMLDPHSDKRVLKTVEAIWGIASNWEQLRLSVRPEKS